MSKRSRRRVGLYGFMLLATPATISIIITLFIDYRYALAQLGLVLAVILAFLLYGQSTRNRVVRMLDNAGKKLDTGALFINSGLPVLVFRSNQEIAWYNEAFIEITGLSQLQGYSLTSALCGEDISKFSFDELRSGVVLKLGERRFMAYVSAMREGSDPAGDPLSMMVFLDITRHVTLEKEYTRSRAVVCIITIDNLDEISQNAKESEKAPLLGGVDNILHEWAAPTNGLLQMLDRGKYLFLFEERYIKGFLSDKFSVLDQVRQIPSNVGVTPTISIGIGRGGDTLHSLYELASGALDMALSRGGDQVVIKRDDNTFDFFGGKTKAVERRTKVRARVMASSLSELIDAATNVIIMGHKYSDFDALGSSVGVARIAMTKGKPVNIVINRENCPALPLLNHIEVMEDYQGVFVDPIEAMDMISSETLLIICDTHNPDIVESADLYHAAKSVVVLDHHRRMANAIDDAVLSYHETYASSTSEIVCELVQYIDGGASIKRREAEAMLAGIILDTNTFYFKTSFRTFEAAAYLKKMGADTIEVKKLFQVDFDSYQHRTDLITSAKLFMDITAISTWSGALVDDYKVTMAQAADEMLGIEGVEASFVLAQSGDLTHISARSLGALNVQLIMEALGGGGHMTNAGAQVKTANIKEGYALVTKAIGDYLKENTQHR